MEKSRLPGAKPRHQVMPSACIALISQDNSSCVISIELLDCALLQLNFHSFCTIAGRAGDAHAPVISQRGRRLILR